MGQIFAETYNTIDNACLSQQLEKNIPWND